ncbi:pyridoxal phosphate-dependent aminotransferase [Chachezhania sediminis]|uniref:pyridoxal phosphate-dependent aminotransferase n=1 Tax=Chachezhania sediminis TaxID=2599291 RepID=UPI00131DFAC9|nr:histidinol-phosphate transaminase [Chachezhania sediminis]
MEAVKPAEDMRPDRVRPVPVAGIMDVPPYIQGASGAEGVADPIKLSSNENPYGPGDRVKDAIRGAVDDIHLYPESNASALAEALADFWHLPVDRIVTSTGSDSILPYLMRAYLDRGDEGLFFTDAFPKFRTYAIGQGSVPVEVPRDKDADYVVEPAAVAAAITHRTRMVYIDNPGNPTGVVIPPDTIRAIHTLLPPDVMLVLDEAYAEFSDIGDSGLQLAATADNVVVQRTFSKAFGLAGLRIGWCVAAPHIAEAVLKIRPTFPLSLPGIAGALMALEDGERMWANIAKIRATRATAVAALRAAGWRIPEPGGNFMLLRTEGAPMSYDDAMAALLAKGVLVRPMRLHGAEPAIRITIGTDAQMAPVIDALT